MRSWWIAACLLFCLVSPSEAGPKLKRYEGADAGFVVFSVATNLDYTVYIKRLDQPGRLDVQGSPSRKSDFEAPRIIPTPLYDQGGVKVVPGVVHAIKLPPGKYQIGWMFVRNNLGIISISQKIDLNTDFDVQTGKTSYLGGVQVTSAFGPGGSYASRDGVGFLEWRLASSGDSNRDQAIASKKLADLPPLDTFSQPPVVSP